jgi:hypothetical protein
VAQQQKTIFGLPNVLAVGIASPAAAAITSRFGVAGTLIGLALSSIFITAVVDFLKVYLAPVGCPALIRGRHEKAVGKGKELVCVSCRESSAPTTLPKVGSSLLPKGAARETARKKADGRRVSRCRFAPTSTGFPRRHALGSSLNRGTPPPSASRRNAS